MLKAHKNTLNEQIDKAKRLREECDRLGLPHIGVEFTNIVYELSKIIKIEDRK